MSADGTIGGGPANDVEVPATPASSSPPAEAVIKLDQLNEASLIGTIVADWTLMPKVMLAVRSGHFQTREAHAAWEVLCEAHRRGVVPDEVGLRSLTDARTATWIHNCGRFASAPNVDVLISTLQWDAARIQASRGPLKALLAAMGNSKSEPDQVRAIAKQLVLSLHGVGTPTKEGFAPIAAGAMDRPLPPVPYLLRCFGVAPGRPTILAGYGEAGKSWAGWDLALAGALGSDWCGQSVAQGRVAIVDYELGRDEGQRRLRRLAVGRGIQLESLGDALVAESFPCVHLDSPNAATEFQRIAEGRMLVLVDAFLPAHAALRSENDSAARKGLDMLSRVSDATGCTFVVVHHEGKPPSTATAPGRKRKHALRGSSALYDACGAVLAVASDGHGTIEIEQVKASRGPRGPSLFVRLEDCGEQDGFGDWTGIRIAPANEVDVAAVRAGDNVGRLRVVISERLRAGSCTRKDLFAKIVGRHSDKLAALDSLRAGGEITESQGPRGALVLALRQGVLA